MPVDQQDRQFLSEHVDAGKDLVEDLDHLQGAEWGRLSGTGPVHGCSHLSRRNVCLSGSRVSMF